MQAINKRWVFSLWLNYSEGETQPVDKAGSEWILKRCDISSATLYTAVQEIRKILHNPQRRIPIVWWPRELSTTTEKESETEDVNLWIPSRIAIKAIIHRCIQDSSPSVSADIGQVRRVSNMIENWLLRLDSRLNDFMVMPATRE